MGDGGTLPGRSAHKNDCKKHLTANRQTAGRHAGSTAHGIRKDASRTFGAQAEAPAPTQYHEKIRTVRTDNPLRNMRFRSGFRCAFYRIFSSILPIFSFIRTFSTKNLVGGEFPNFAPGIGTLIASKGIPAPPFGSRPASKKRRIVFFRFPPGIVRTSAARHPDRRNPDFFSPLYPPRRFPDEVRIASGQTKPSRSAKSNPKNKALPMKH